MWNPDVYHRALRFATEAHQGQHFPGTELPYLLHLSAICGETLRAVLADPDLDADLAVQCALLHDTIEDTETAYSIVLDQFGQRVAAGVAALTKNPDLPKSEQMADSLARIRQQPPEIRIVKMADRGVNLQAPPHYWTDEKKRAYREEAVMILVALGGVNAYIEQRLGKRIEEYGKYIAGDSK